MDDFEDIQAGPGDGSGRWRLAADGVAAVVCVAAIVWTFVLGERVPLLAAADLGFHELGHMLGGALPGLMPALAGTFLQLLVPGGLAAYFGAVRREEFAVALMLAWLGTSARDASVYIADAPYERLPLIGGTHDWAAIFGSIGHLDWAEPVATVVWVCGLLCVIAGLAVGTWPFIRVAIERRRRSAYERRVATLPRHDPRNPVVRPSRETPGLENPPIPPSDEVPFPPGSAR
ncbi:MAG: hypothetical protein Q7W30_08260 [Coriobacteriia bacterium]|nr:hypothetical protein [Coriobacteriia bacterium]